MRWAEMPLIEVSEGVLSGVVEVAVVAVLGV